MSIASIEETIYSRSSVSVVPYDDRESGPNLSRRKSSNVGETERWASIISGVALIVTGLRKADVPGLAVSALGGGLLWRGVTGHCGVYAAIDVNTNGNGSKGLHIVKAVTINKAPDELFRFWRNFENLPNFMQHLESVTQTDSTHSHWIAKAPAGQTVSWDAEIINERANELIAWRSTENAAVENMGTVTFTPAPAGRGTEVKVNMLYSPPGGIVGAQIAKLWGEEPSLQIEGDLMRFKRLMETGEIPTTEGQSRG